MQNVQLSPVV